MDTPESKPSLSRTPSWVMVGFLLGAATIYSVRDKLDRHPAAPAPAAATQPTPTPAPAAKVPVNDVEAIFTQYQHAAIWRNDVTEVAIWNGGTQRFSDLYEVFRNGDAYYFRSITTLTRPVIEYADEEGLPIRFTETEENREKRLEKVPYIFRQPPPKL